MYAGYENCEIFRSEDGGEHWQQLPVTVRFPEVTVAPGANPAKRVLELAGNPANPNEIYGAIEVGRHHPEPRRRRALGEHEPRAVRERRHRGHARRAGRPLASGHGVRHRPRRPVRSTDQGEHWASARLEPLNAKGQTYCRDIREVPGDPKTIWVAAGANFQSDVGVLFRSKDGGMSWKRVDMGVKPQTTMFALAFDARQPRRMYCATSGGEVFASEDGGQSWTERPLPEGATQVYAMGCA